MYINRIILRDVRNFKHLDITLRNDWTEQPLKSVLFTGPNGSGKTTLLRAITALWDMFGKWLTPLNQFVEFPAYWINAGLVAVELCDFPLIEGATSTPNSIWLYFGRSQKHMGDFRASVSQDALLIGDHIAGIEPPKIRVPPSWNNTDAQKALYSWRQKMQVGADNIQPLSNLIFLEAETRHITPSPDETEARAEIPYQWLVTYGAKDHIELMLKNLNVRNSDLFKQVSDQISAFLVDKELDDFDNLIRLQVRLKDGQTHYIEELSAGERQCLIMIFMVTRWLMPGGIVLIDEPDLHLHVSLQRHFIHTVEKIVHAREGQLIVTSHSPTLWEEFNERQRINLAEEDQHGD
jgi:ABC-type lipoprotein export system ATPase subunit